MGIFRRIRAAAAGSLGGQDGPVREAAAHRSNRAASSTSPVVFMHVPKTAGSSLTNMLVSQYPPDRVYRPEGRASLSQLQTNELESYQLFCGHFDWSQFKYLPKTSRVITILRDPIDRILSLYRYWRSFSWEYAEQRNDFGIQYAKSVGLHEFFFDAPLGIRANYENAVVRQLVGADFCQPHVGFSLADEQTVQLAKYRISGLAVCGVTDDFQGSSDLIARCLGLPQLQVRFDNRTRPPDDCNNEAELRNRVGDALLARLNALTHLDRQIFQYARAKHRALVGAPV